MNQTYIVKAGDTLYGISKQYGVSLSELININNVKPENLRIGEQLIIPSNVGMNPEALFKYTVKKGDTLYNIAKKYDTSVDMIKSLNNLNTNILSIGQELMIPENYSDISLPTYVNYTVKKGDTLYSIAKSNGITVDQIIKDNNLTNNILNVGRILKIRTQVVEECFGPDYNDTIYTVKKGDTLYSIAKKYNKPVDEIKKNNKLSSNTLSIGQQLII